MDNHLKCSTEWLDNALNEVKKYNSGHIFYTDKPMPKNHLYCIRGVYCDFYGVSDGVVVFVKPEQIQPCRELYFKNLKKNIYDVYYYSKWRTTKKGQLLCSTVSQ